MDQVTEMMTWKLRILLIVIFLLVLIWLIRQVGKKVLDLRYILSWLLLDIGLLVLSIFPGILNRLARMLGIYNPVNMIFFSGFCFALVIIYTLTVAVCKMADEIKCLAQRIALLERKQRVEKEEKNNENGIASADDL